MLEQTVVEWLASERPAPLALGEQTTARVREELLAYMADPGAGDRTDRARRLLSRRPLARRSRARGGRRPLRIAISAGALAAIASAALLATDAGSGRHPSTGIVGLINVQPAVAAPLAHLSAKLAAAPPPRGDATLVLRRQVYPNSPEIDGADLYADSGDYYYATSLSGLPAVIKAGETVNSGSSDQEVRDIEAAKAALNAPIDSARQQMSIANLDPGVKPSSISPTGAARAKALAKLPADVRRKIEAVERADAADDVQPVMSQEDGMIWDNSMDALLAGAGNPQVRAGVLKLLGTIPQVAVTHGTLDGKPTLVLTAALQTSNSSTYQEQLIVNAGTGIPMQFVGGNVGQTPSVTVYYTISRVTVSAIEAGGGAGS
jgi:hypothetical protein